MFEVYIMSAIITAIGMFYKYNFSRNGQGLSFRDKDWLLIFLPILNTIMMFGAIMLIFFDLTFRVVDFFEDRR